MFGKKEKGHKETSLQKYDIKAFLGGGSHFEGKLTFNEIARLDGSFRGEVTSTDTLIIGESGDMQAEIGVGALILSGRLRGNVKAAHKVELRAPARLDGDIETPLLVIEEGVVFNGKLTMPVRKPAAAGTGLPKGKE